MRIILYIDINIMLTQFAVILPCVFVLFFFSGPDTNLSTRPEETSAVLLLAFIISAAFILWCDADRWLVL